MTVERRIQPEWIQDCAQTRKVFGQPFGPDAHVLDETYRLGRTRATGEQRQPGAPQTPHQFLLGGVTAQLVAQAEAPSTDLGRPCVVIEELDQQQGLARIFIEPEQLAGGGESAFSCRLVEDRPIEVFNGRGAKIGELHRCLQRLHDRFEKNNAEGAVLRFRHDANDRRRNPRQRSFAARHQLSQISRRA